MTTHANTAPPGPGKPVVYPDSDGEPMADNTEHFEFIQAFQGNLDYLLPHFVAGDHLWYPVEGHPEICIGPDVYVAMGRPQGTPRLLQAVGRGRGGSAGGVRVVVSAP